MNRMKKRIILLFMFVLASFCYARQVSFQVVQHNNSVEEVTEEARVVEDALIDSFFEYGYIVTNSEASIARNYVDDSNLWKIGMNEAVSGYSDFFVQVILEFTEKFDETINRNVMILDKAQYRINDTVQLNELGSGEFVCGLKINSPSDLAIVSDSLIFEINKVLNA